MVEGVIHQIRFGMGMEAICGVSIGTTYSKRGKPSYDPKWTLSDLDTITCLECLRISKERKAIYMAQRLRNRKNVDGNCP